MSNEIQRIKGLLRHIYFGPAWHGPAVMEVIADLPVEKLTRRIEKSNNIAELVYHMASWRIYAIKKLEGDVDYDVDDETNFLKLDHVSEKEWEILLDRLESSQEKLAHILEAIPESKLMEKVPGRQYNFYFLLHGIIQHDLYHLGQIVLLKKLQ